MSKKPFNYLSDKHNQTQNHCTNSDGDKEENKDYEPNAITNAAVLKRTNRVKHEDKIKELEKKKQKIKEKFEMKKQELEEIFKKETQQINEQIKEWNNENQQITESNEEDDQNMKELDNKINDIVNPYSSNSGNSIIELPSENEYKFSSESANNNQADIISNINERSHNSF